MIGPIPGATTPLKQQDILIGGNLSTWGAKEAMRAIWTEAVDLHKNFARYESMEEVGLRAVNAAARRGTTIHDHVALLLAGETPTPTVETSGYVYAWTSFLAAERPEFLLVEQKVIHPKALFAGTLDFVAKLRSRRAMNTVVALGDVKSGSWKQSFILQLAAYSMCRVADERLTLDRYHRYMWAGTLEDIAALPKLPRIDEYLILLLRENGYELVPVVVTDDDRRHYLRLVQTFHAMKAWDEAHKNGVHA